jgi:hypothetical protein
MRMQNFFKILRKISFLRKLNAVLKSINCFITTPLLSHFSQVFDERIICDQYVTEYAGYDTVDNRYVHLFMGSCLIV